MDAQKRDYLMGKPRLTRDEVERGLAMYVGERLTGMEFSRRMGISYTYGDELLAGFYWRDVVRPAGFQYPWPDARIRPHRRKDGQWLRLPAGTTEPPVYTPRDKS